MNRSTVDEIGLTAGLTSSDLTIEETLDGNRINSIIRIASSNQILGIVNGVTFNQQTGNFVSVEV